MSTAGFDDLLDLERDLTGAADLMPHKAGQAVQQAAMHTKQEWQKQAKGNPMGGRYTSTIDYTVDEFGGFGQGVFEAEIGPDLARYGGKTGRGGLMPSAGIFDDPLSQGSIRRAPDRARRRAEKFASDDLDKGIEIALEQSLAEAKLGSVGGAAAAIIRGSV